MDLKSLQRKARPLIDRRGGTGAHKADAEELKDIAKGPAAARRHDPFRVAPHAAAREGR
jgi:hypothetical protein